MSKPEHWVWMPHPGHFICGFDCRFRLTTYVGGYLVSTVGEYFPDAPVREILAQSRGIKLVGHGDERKHDFMTKVGFEEIGLDRKYETMVFRAERDEYNKCCPYRMSTPGELDMEGYNTPEAAFEGHMKLCRKWAKKRLRK